MENTRNPGLVAVAVGVALAVLFALLGITTVLSGQIGFGLAAVCLVVSALMYIFYARGTAINKTGFGALIAIVAVGLIIPVLMVDQQQAQADQQHAQYIQTLQRGAAIYSQYCATCHGYLGQGLNAPQLNNSTAVNKLADTDLTRIISAGIPGDPTNPAQLAMPAWLDTYGGSLTSDDISYLLAFIRSSDPSYLATKGLPNINGFNYVYSTLINATQQAAYKQQKASGSGPTASQFTDETGKKTLTIQIINTPNGTAAWGFSPQYVLLSPGTTVTWNNISNNFHTVVTRTGTTPPQPFGSTTTLLQAGTGTYTFTFTKPGDYPYWCSIHPAMLAWIRVK